ncbi:MAG: PadR family transcriptional regulator [Anaerovoracaceae bacterium]|jgi:PadR family transcriptional regulator AphA
MALKHGLLGLLTYGSATGYELNKRFQDSLSFFWKGSTSQIYRELNAMEGMGWLTSEYVIQKGKPNKRVYTITEEGRTELRGWISAEDAGIEDALNAKSAFLVNVIKLSNESK